MGLSIPEAIAAASAPGQPFETVVVERNGVSYREFKNAPSNMRSVFDGARNDPNTFIVYEDEEWSFSKVMSEADALGYALVHTFGIKPGDRVGIAMRNLPEWVISFAAILSVGGISVSLNAWWTEDELEYGINDAGLSVLIADAERVLRAGEAAYRAGVPVIAVRSDEMLPTPPGVQRWNDVVVRGQAMPEVDVTADMDATILFTSGTTGRPKGAVSTHRAVTQALMAFSAGGTLQSLRRGPVPESEATPNLPTTFILIVPLFHVTGCVPVMLSCFMWHFKLVMMYRWEPERALQLIERHRVTNFVGVPTQSWDMLECPNFDKYDTSSLIAIGGGGAPAPPKLVDRVSKSFKKGGPTLGYGMTETNAYGPGNSGADYLARPTSTGAVPTIIMDVEIRDENGQPVPTGESGEVWMKSPTLIRGYWNKPEATASTLTDGWLHSGDVGRIEADGFLYLEDRLKDMIIRAGENVYSAEVEAAIYEHPAIYEAAVLGLPHERLGEEVAAVVMLREGQDLDEDGLRNFLSGKLASFMIPTSVVFTHEPLPRNPAGKFLKRDMPERYFAR